MIAATVSIGCLNFRVFTYGAGLFLRLVGGANYVGEITNPHNNGIPKIE